MVVFTLIFSKFPQFFLIMTNEESKRRLAINFKLKMCFSLNWYLKVPVSPPVFYFRKYVLTQVIENKND